MSNIGLYFLNIKSVGGPTHFRDWRHPQLVSEPEPACHMEITIGIVKSKLLLGYLSHLRHGAY